MSDQPILPQPDLDPSKPTVYYADWCYYSKKLLEEKDISKDNYNLVNCVENSCPVDVKGFPMMKDKDNNTCFVGYGSGKDVGEKCLPKPETK